MIVFKGEMTKACKSFWLSQEMKSKMFSQLAFAVVAGAFAVFGTAFYGARIVGWVSYFILAIVLAFPVLFLIPKCIKHPIGKSDIVIRDDGYMISQSTFMTVRIKMDDVIDVLDMGDWYHIRYKDFEHPGAYICQKNLIVKGTLEEFENLFGDKISRA